MKKYINISYLLASLFILLTACSEEIFSPTTLGDNVTLSLSYSDVSPKEITVNTRATYEDERHLDNLYIYIFDASGKLKGFKAIESASELDQNTSNSRKAGITGIKTRAGESYIYAVANIKTGLYPVATSEGRIESGKLPINLDEEKAQAGEYDFTKADLLSLPFTRNEGGTIDVTSAFLMSGAVQGGNEVTITKNGTIPDGDNAIRLSRIVSKVKFTIKAESGKNFKLDTYEIRNIAMNGSLVGTIDNNTRKECTDVSGISATLGNNDVEDGAQFFEVYVPENLQTKQNSVSKQEDREADVQEGTDKIFTNAPQYGTYVVLKGQYEENKADGNRIIANVVYYVHLGDIQASVNNYDVERNCKYTYNITVAGVNKIIVEAKREGNDQPGAEGLVLEYGTTNKTLTLDSHYDYMVMRFYQSDIKQLKQDSDGKLGYYYQVYALGKHTEPMNVGETTTGSNPDNVDTSWIEFAISCSRDNSTSTYSSANDGRGEPCSYPGTNYKNDLYNIEAFLKLLYNNAENDSFWNKTDNGSRYIDATCFVNENYYKDLSWDQYVNKVDRRAFYVANHVETSNDGRSVYATTQYGLHQHNIQTFYDTKQAGSVIAYGCETINDEEGKEGFNTGSTRGKDTWNGRTNMLSDINTRTDTWASLKNNKSLVKACMSRNRDLNGNGTIDNNEIRWYAPTQAQYAGLWIGEEILNSEAKLFNKSTSILDVVKGDEPAEKTRMLYYAADSKQNTFFSEEGMATANNNETYPATYVRCLRNLKSYDYNDEGYAAKPTEYYSYNTSTRLLKLDKVDDDALNITAEQGELQPHTEREKLNKPAKEFYVAATNHNTGNPTQQQVVEGTFKCNGNYTENGTKTWRVPNQREFTMMVVTSNIDLVDTFCKTKFSNEKFRYSWTYKSNGRFTMDVTQKTSSGKGVRCIKPVKE